MSVAACLLLYSLAVSVFGPRLLLRWTRSGVAPRLGVAVWLVAIGSIVASWIVAAVFLAAELVHTWSRPGHIVSSCFAALNAVATGGAGVVLQLGLFVLAAFAIAAAVVLAARLGRSLLRARSRTHDHARMMRVVGRRIGGVDARGEAVVLDAPERVAYCVAGRPSTIVVTSGALDALDDRHLGAVLAHERAHLAGRHHLLLAATRGLAAVLPRIELFTVGAAEIARLLEMCADDTAVRTHGSRTVLGALLTLSGAAPTTASLPARALGATGVGVVARAERLAAPPDRARSWRMRLLLVTVAVLLAAGPLIAGLFAAICDPIIS